MEALGIKLLQRLSSSLTSVEGISTAEHRNELREFRRKVGLSLNVLKELGGYANRTSVGTNVSTTDRKRAKAVARHPKLDPHPFDCMRIEVPMTEDQVHVVCGDILRLLQNALGVRVSPSFLLNSNTYPVSALFARPEAASGIGIFQTPTRRSRNRNDVLRIHNPANQGRSVLRKRGGVRRVADFTID